MKKFFSIMLALVMVLGLMSVGAMAADPIVFEDFDSYADVNAAKVNWSTVNVVPDDGNGGKALQVNIGGTPTEAASYFKSTPDIEANVYTISFRVKTEREYEGAKIEFLSSSTNVLFSGTPTTDWTTVSGTVSWTDTMVPRFKVYGPTGSSQKYFIDDIVFTPYAGNLLEGLNADFNTYSATEVVGVTGQGATFEADATTMASGTYAYDTGADGTGYSLKIHGDGVASGVNFNKIMAPAKELRVKFKLRSTLLNKQVLRLTIGSEEANNYTTYPALGVTTTGWEEKELTITPEATTDGKSLFYVRAANYLKEGDYLWIDDIEITVVDNEVAAPQPPVVEPTEYAVTINTDANANITLTDAVVEAGEATTFTVAPKFGYYIQSITVGGTAIDVLDAYKGGTYSTGAIEDDTAIVVTIAALADSNITGVSSAVATLPTVFAEAGEHVTFGKVLDANATEYGIELRYENGEPVKTAKTQTGPEFKALSKNENGQYAVEIEGLAAGTYKVRTYVKVAGTTTFGAATTFVVE